MRPQADGELAREACGCILNSKITIILLFACFKLKCSNIRIQNQVAITNP